MHVIGFDPGNSESTLTWRQGAALRHLTIPSFVGSGRLQELRRVRSATSDGALRRDEIALTYHGAAHFVGQLAIEESRDATAARNDVSRYWNGHTIRLLLALVAQANISGPIRVMTGLPVSAWTAESKRLVQQSLCGEHLYTANGKDRSLVVDAVGVMMEGAAVLASAPIVDAPQAVIDIGGRTTDLFWSYGVRPVAQRCHAAEIGVERAGDLLRQETLEQHQRELTDQELRSILYAYVTGKPRRIFNRGKELVLNGSLDAALATVGQQIVSYIGARWGDDRGVVAGEAARVVLIGGGAHYFGDVLRQAIPHVEIPRPPELANALGYLAVGQSAPEEAWARNRG